MSEQVETEIVIDPPKPHSRKQELIMRAFLYPSVKEVFVACGSKFGKTLASSTCLVNAAMGKSDAKWRWIAPIYRQSKIGMEYIAKLLPPPPYSEAVDSKMVIKVPGIKSAFEFWHTQNPVDLEGAGIHGQIGDEAAKMPYQAYISAKTTTLFTKGPSMWVSTPYGKNWFYNKFVDAKERMQWAIGKGIDPTFIAIHAPTTDNPYVSQETIDQAKKDLPERLFRQYYLAEFLDEGSVFVGVTDCVYGAPIESEGAIQYWLEDESETFDVVIGADWAKLKDYAVFIAIDCQQRKVVGFSRFHGISYVEASKELYKFSKRFKSTVSVYHDKTGVGEALDDLLGHFPLDFHGVTFSNSSKSSLINSLGLAFEKKELRLCNWPTLLKELDSYEVTVSETGTMRYSAPEGGHDDTVIALALANAALNEAVGDYSVRFAEDLPSDKSISDLDSYYKKLLIENADDSPF